MNLMKENLKIWQWILATVVFYGLMFYIAWEALYNAFYAFGGTNDVVIAKWGFYSTIRDESIKCAQILYKEEK